MNTLLTMVMAVIRWHVEHYTFWILFAFALTIPAAGTILLAPRIAAMFGFGESGEAIPWAICFFGFLAAETWLYERVQRWRFFRGKP
jgi:hypothetical protein